MNIIINGKNFEFNTGETILEIAYRNSIEIPNLCYDKRFVPYTSCFVCIVKDQKTGRIIPSCSTKAADSMSVITEDEEIVKLRKMALELLLSEHDADCFAPCKSKCPSNIDVRDYIVMLRSERALDAFQTIRKKNPFVTTCGRVCPAPCEEDCTRNYIDEPVGIRKIKRSIADIVYPQMFNELFASESEMRNTKISQNKSKKIAVIGAGPAGLSSAYYLLINGFSVDIFEQFPKSGGMLRFAIPKYRLPETVLNQEIDSIIRLGANLHTNKKIDKQKLADLSKEYNAVIIATGAGLETKLGLGEDSYPNVYSALCFLYGVASGKNYDLKGKKVIVIGGGNSAIDSARSAVRLGATKTSILYRRTRAEMPAHDFEIEDAICEGVEISELMSPLSLTQNSMQFQKMQVTDELDKTGRKKTKAIDGDVQTLDFDYLIYAIGQYPDPELAMKSKTLYTGQDNIFIAGDCRTGASIIIQAVAEGRKAADEVIRFLGAESSKDEMAFNSRREKGLLISDDFKKITKIKNKMISDNERKHTFIEVETAFSKTENKEEGERCISCGCKAINECSLRDYSIEYKADANRFKTEGRTEISKKLIDQSTGHIVHDNSKCIKCGKCIKVCSIEVGANALSFIKRGIETIVAAGVDTELGHSACISCGECIDSCPTGALSENLNKDVIWRNIEEKNDICKGCILNCSIKAGFENGKLVRVRADKTPLCFVGRWNWVNNFDTPQKIKIDKNLIADSAAIFDECDYVLVLGYNPSADNPRVFFELKKLYNNKSRDIEIDTIFEMDDEVMETLVNSKNPLVIFNTLDFSKELYDAVIAGMKGKKGFLLPVYYR